MYRTHTCGELRINHAGIRVTLAGWVQTIRKFGSITFVDLRDRYGITQLLFGEELNQQLESNPLGREFVIQVSGTVNERSSKNANIPTGAIEIAVQSFVILNKSAVPPFTIQDDTDGGDDLRMKYRFLDLRRNAVKRNIELRYAVNRAARNYLHANGFMDIETPFLIKSTPEGARDFVVPSRMNPGQEGVHSKTILIKYIHPVPVKLVDDFLKRLVLGVLLKKRIKYSTVELNFTL
jgi:aspartyl-tRNA synthetase